MCVCVCVLCRCTDIIHREDEEKATEFIERLNWVGCELLVLQERFNSNFMVFVCLSTYM